MALTDVNRLRDLLGEPIPDGGTEADTLFTDDRLKDFLQLANNDVERAAFEGWRAKAAQLANLVDVADGNASRKMSDLLDNAQTMVKFYQRSSTGPTEGRTRIGRIVRS